MPIAIKVILVVICSYFLGNITFARPVSKTLNDDITTHGSGNPGTMNMMRTYGAKYGFLTLLLDALKGVISCLSAYYIFGGPDGGNTAELMKVIAGFSCIIGHIYPIVYRFKGGKGVATACGIAFCVNPWLICITLLVFTIIIFATEIASVASMSATAFFIFVHTYFYIIQGNYFALIPLYLILFMVVFAHRSNIARLFKGTENKVHVRKIFKKKSKESTIESADVEEVVEETNTNENINDNN